MFIVEYDDFTMLVRMLLIPMWRAFGICRVGGVRPRSYPVMSAVSGLSRGVRGWSGRRLHTSRCFPVFPPSFHYYPSSGGNGGVRLSDDPSVNLA